MRIAISLFFLASMVMFIMTERAVISGVHSWGSAGIIDPQHLVVAMEEAVNRVAMLGCLAAVTLILICISSFMDRAPAKGIFTALVALGGTVQAGVCVLVMVGILKGAQPNVAEEGYSVEVVTTPLVTSHERSMLLLLLLSLGTAAALMGRRKVRATVSESHPPPIPPAS